MRYCKDLIGQQVAHLQVPSLLIAAGEAPAGSFHLELEGPRGTITVHLIGELDIAYSGAVRHAIGALSPSAVVIDLSRLTFMDASGLSAILGARRAHIASGAKLRITGAHDIVRRLFELTGLAEVLDPA